MNDRTDESTDGTAVRLEAGVDRRDERESAAAPARVAGGRIAARDRRR